MLAESLETFPGGLVGEDGHHAGRGSGEELEVVHPRRLAPVQQPAEFGAAIRHQRAQGGAVQDGVDRDVRALVDRARAEPRDVVHDPVELAACAGLSVEGALIQ